MILQALNQYYLRKQRDLDPAARLAPPGLEQKEIPFLLEITAEGSLVQVIDTREVNGKRKVGQHFLVPQGVKKTSGVAANLLWDTLEYVLGVDTRGNPKRVAEQHAAFVSRIRALPSAVLADPGVAAVLRFLENPKPSRWQEESVWQELLESNPVVTFRLQGDADLVCQRPLVVNAALETAASTEAPEGMCLVTGNIGPVERIHPSIKGVWGAQSSGANILSFNARAFESYGKMERQGENAPVGRSATFGYTTALNHLLRQGSDQRTQIGDTSTVFWAERESSLESAVPDIFGEPPKDDPDRGTRAVKELLDAHQSVRLGGLEGAIPFHVLGLAPNAARISIRFYHCLPLRDLAGLVLQHFEDLHIVRGKFDAEFPSIFRLLASVSVQGKVSNAPPNLGGSIVDAILAGRDAPYPSIWLNAAVGRCRAEQSVTYLRAASIKACLNRQIRRSAHHSIDSREQEFLPMLDIDNPSTAYRLGRLFAALEKIQEEANPGLNATIRDRYYPAASSTPVAVFTTLIRLKNPHLKKLSGGRVNQFERLLGEIVGPISDFPAHLSLQDQGRFALGYYHQRQDFYTPKSDKSAGQEENEQ